MGSGALPRLLSVGNKQQAHLSKLCFCLYLYFSLFLYIFILWSPLALVVRGFLCVCVCGPTYTRPQSAVIIMQLRSTCRNGNAHSKLMCMSRWPYTKRLAWPGRTMRHKSSRARALKMAPGTHILLPHSGGRNQQGSHQKDARAAAAAPHYERFPLRWLMRTRAPFRPHCLSLRLAKSGRSHI